MRLGEYRFIMKPCSMLILSVVFVMCFREVPPVQGQGAPEIIWEAATPSGLANSIQGVGWSPIPSERVAFGSTDRCRKSLGSDLDIRHLSRPQRGKGAKYL